jgi:hypothetical protein
MSVAQVTREVVVVTANLGGMLPPRGSCGKSARRDRERPWSRALVRAQYGEAQRSKLSTGLLLQAHRSGD